MGAAWPEALVRRTRRMHRSVAYPLLAFLLPTDCFACRRPLGAVQRLGACPDCWAGLRPLARPLCTGCGLPGPPTTDLLGPARGRCAACILRPPTCESVRAVVAYDHVARAFLLRAKLGRRPELLEPLGRLLAATVRLLDLAEGCAAVVAVPSHPWATWSRGFSPGALLARCVGRATGLPVRRRLLARRVGVRGAIKRLGAPARRLRLADAFRVRGELRGERLLLVDDVMTTGATVEGCARALIRAGAGAVRVAVWARTLPGNPRGPGARPGRHHPPSAVEV